MTPTNLGLLYRVVFMTRYTLAVVFVLLLSFIIQPVGRSFAAESDSTSTTLAPDSESKYISVSTTTTETSSIVFTQPTLNPEPTAILNEVAPPGVALSSPDKTVTALFDTASNTDLAVSADSAIAQPVESTTTTGSWQATTSSEYVEELLPSDANLTSLALPAVDNGFTPTISTQVIETVPLETPNDVATSSIIDVTATSGETIVAQSVVQNDSQIQFDKSSCLLVSDGQFYCQTKATTTASRPDGLYSLPDVDGDLEIYMQRGGVLTQITHNTVDDSSPFFDSDSNTIVWQRLINDRYQIVSYAVTTGEETQITNGTVNNMEPTRAGTYTVWQHWNNSWQIMLDDGSTQMELTHSVENNLSPSIRNGLLVWHSMTADGVQSIQLYNLKTKEFTTINDSDAGAISNPRMVVMYDSKSQNGDVVTRGYDLVTGQIIDLGTTPVPLPDKLPAPDSTGETRALIQAKTSAKESVSITDDITPVAGIEPHLNNATSTPTSFDLIVSASSTPSLLLVATTSVAGAAVATTSSTTSVATSSLTLDLTSTVATDTPAVDTSFDIVVPPYAATIPQASTTTSAN